MIVALAGYAGSGKDTAAEALIELGWKRMAFADPIKEVATIIGWDGQKDDFGRQLLQNLGMAVRQVVAEDVWVQALFNAVGDDDVVITDLRFPIEAAEVKRRGGKTIRIERPGVTAVNGHISESALDNHAFDAVIANDSTIEDLHWKLLEAVS